MTRGTAYLCAFISFISLSLDAAQATDARMSNTAPLAFGMTQQQAADALGAPLTLVGSGRHGSEIYLAARDARVPGYPVGERVVLQFRRAA